MTCICEARQLSENFKVHSTQCDEYNRKMKELSTASRIDQLERKVKKLEERELELLSHIRWVTQDHPCSGSGYSHKAHGKCPGYSTDRT